MRLLLLAVLLFAAGVSLGADIVVDNDKGAPQFVSVGEWEKSLQVGYRGSSYMFVAKDKTASYAVWTPSIPAGGKYKVHVAFRGHTNRTTGAPFTVAHADGTTVVRVNQNAADVVHEALLGVFRFEAGEKGYVRLDTGGTDGACIADAVIFRPHVPAPPRIRDVRHYPKNISGFDPVCALARVMTTAPLAAVTVHFEASPSGRTGTVACHDDGAHFDGEAGDRLFAGFIPRMSAGQTVTYRFAVANVFGDETTGAQHRYTVSDADFPPYIDMVTRLADKVTSGAVASVRARVHDESGLDSVRLEYAAASDGTTRTVEAVADDTPLLAGAKFYSALLPGHPAGEAVSYQFSATDKAGQTSSSVVRMFTVLPGARAEFRVMQVDSWAAGILKPEQVEEFVAQCRASNLNTVMPEVRKVGDALYESKIEPRASNVAEGFDPLARIIELAHDTSGGKPRIGVHAWFVMHRIAKGEGLHSDHVLSRHPEYEMLKSDGTRGTNNRYLDPGHPGTVDHNIAVILDCLGRYDIDGINCDYIRYPEDPGAWGYNPVSVTRFNAHMGRSGTPDPLDPEWCNWRRECVTLEVKKLYVKAWKMKPRVLLTCDTTNWGGAFDNFTASAPYKTVFQDWVGWLDQCVLDYNCPMNYADASRTERFQGWARLSLESDSKRGSIIGIGAYLHPTVQHSMDQLLWLREQGADGFFIYDWGSEVKANTKGETREKFYAELARQVTPSWADAPTPAWKTNPVNGIIEGVLKWDGQPIDHARVMLEGMEGSATVSDGSGWYAILNVPPGTHTVLFSKPGMSDAKAAATVAKGGDIVTVNAEMSPPMP